jgi:hypothetical protein
MMGLPVAPPRGLSVVVQNVRWSRDNTGLKSMRQKLLIEDRERLTIGSIANNLFEKRNEKFEKRHGRKNRRNAKKNRNTKNTWNETE